MVATAIIGSAVVGAGASVAGSSMQAGATKDASNQEMQMYNQTRADLLPYNTTGQNALTQLWNTISGQTQPTYTPVVMDQATLQQTPGYQFNLNQGLKSVQNSAAARGLGNSGAALKGAASYATGLADSTYQNQFNNATTNALNVYNSQVQGQTNAYNRLLGLANLGENAGAQTGAYGTQTANQIGQNTIAGGTAQAAGLNGAASSLSNGANAYANYNLLSSRGLYNNNSYPPQPASYPY